MSNNSSTIPKSLHDFYQGAPEQQAEEMSARFQHAFNENIKLRNENFRLQMRLDDALQDVQVSKQKILNMKEAGNNYISQLEVRVAEERDALLIRVGYLERTIEQLKGEKK